MPLPSGSWDITASGLTGALTFVGNSGSISGTIFGDHFVGFFDETSQSLTILRNPQVAAEGGFSGVLMTPLTVYSGSLFQFTPPGAATPTSVLTGVVSTISGSGPASDSTWYAQNPQPVKTAKEGKDGGKDHKDHKDHPKEVAKETIKEAFVEKLPEIQRTAPSHPLSSIQTAEPGAIGKSFIKADERPPVGETILSDSENEERTRQ